MTDDKNWGNLHGYARTGKTTHYYTPEQINRLSSGGIFFVDPQGDDSEQLLNKIPQDRLDVIVWTDEVNDE